MKGKVVIIALVIGLLAGAFYWKFKLHPEVATTVEEDTQPLPVTKSDTKENATPQVIDQQSTTESQAKSTGSNQVASTVEPPRFDREEINRKRELLKSEAEKMRNEMMKKLQQLNSKGKELEPEMVLKELYKDDDPSSYSPQKKAYLEEIAKPFMMNELKEDEELGNSKIDFNPVMSKAYDLLEKVDEQNIKALTSSFLKIPKNIRDDISKGEFRSLQQKLANAGQDQLENIAVRLQDSHDERVTEETQKLFEKIRSYPNGDKYVEDMNRVLISTAQLHLLSK